MSEVSQPNLLDLIEHDVPFAQAWFDDVDEGEIISQDEIDMVKGLIDHIRALVEENKRDKLNAAYLQDIIKSVQTELQHTREELEQRTNERNKAAVHVIGWRAEAESLRTELSAKNKVLEMYANNDMYTVLHLGCSPMVMADRGLQASIILKEYEVIPNES